MKKKPVAGPFDQLEELLKEAGIELGVEDKKSPPARKTLPEPQTAEPATDEALFQQAMEGVSRSSWRHFPIRTAPEPSTPLPDGATQEKQLMEAAVAGDPALRAPDHPEYTEGWVGVAAKRFLPGLRDGIYSIQGQLDLHGLDREEARLAVEEFVGRMSRFRPCCVKIIHGRGINSPNDRAILKESLQRWLSTRRLSKHVVAYASAPMNDGGVGAIYVLLRSRF